MIAIVEGTLRGIRERKNRETGNPILFDGKPVFSLQIEQPGETGFVETSKNSRKIGEGVKLKVQFRLNVSKDGRRFLNVREVE